MNNVARALVDRLTVKFAGEIAQDTDGYDLFKLCDGAWGGGTGLRGGGSSVNFLQIGEAQTCFIRNGGGGVTVFLGKEKIYPCRLVDSSLLTNTRSL